MMNNSWGGVMTTADLGCLTCNDSDISSGQYETIKTYVCERRNTTSVDNKAAGNFKSVNVSEKKKRIREMNKLVSKWK